MSKNSAYNQLFAPQPPPGTMPMNGPPQMPQQGQMPAMRLPPQMPPLNEDGRRQFYQAVREGNTQGMNQYMQPQQPPQSDYPEQAQNPLVQALMMAKANQQNQMSNIYPR